MITGLSTISLILGTAIAYLRRGCAGISTRNLKPRMSASSTQFTCLRWMPGWRASRHRAGRARSESAGETHEVLLVFASYNDAFILAGSAQDCWSGTRFGALVVAL